ncbi:hypothetical protein [Butyrivibrio sp. YAB3001]|uniref:hypothetical protein n=1 Tax=Butyrivibrio sp. YAB3001 TaxID=1520812 RepID=UPI0008F64017|nr:hypothetical protein [Butyrivibrio sp. YAB3001]SFC64557.1 hypothetical protein SAMN02910398_02761 [Butyrivibrio sp. YAB3001]
MKKRFDTKQKSTFIVKVMDCQNGTWQGKIIYAEENRIRYFRSMLEMIKMIDEVVGESEMDENASNL